MSKISFLSGLLCFIVVSSFAQQSRLWYTYPTDDKVIYDICFAPTGEALAIADNISIKVFSAVTGELTGRFENGHTGKILSLDISRDGNFLVSGGKDSTIVVWDFKHKVHLHSLKSSALVKSVSFSPDAQFLAFGGSDGNLYVYDIKKQQLINTHSHHKNDISSVVFSPDGQYLASAGGDKKIHIYRVGILVATLSGHKSWVREISFDSEGKKLISCSDDGRVILWDVSDMTAPRILSKNRPGGTAWLMSVDFNEDDITHAMGDSKGNAFVITQFGKASVNVKSPVQKILFSPGQGTFLSIVVATRGKGVIKIDGANISRRKR
jgi:WD40 repeat protein